MSERRECPDGGGCHHNCKQLGLGCFRVNFCAPLSAAGYDDWPEEIKRAEARPPADIMETLVNETKQDGQ